METDSLAHLSSEASRQGSTSWGGSVQKPLVARTSASTCRTSVTTFPLLLSRWVSAPAALGSSFFSRCQIWGGGLAPPAAC